MTNSKSPRGEGFWEIDMGKTNKQSQQREFWETELQDPYAFPWNFLNRRTDPPEPKTAQAMNWLSSL